MTTANTTATTAIAALRHSDGECGTPRRWALTLAVMALLGLAMLVSLGAEFGTGVQAAADTDQTVAVQALGGAEARTASIRWVR